MAQQTLEEWAVDNQCRPALFDKPTYDKMMVIADRGNHFPDRPGLWNLADYFVSSVTGGSIWLAQRP